MRKWNFVIPFVFMIILEILYDYLRVNVLILFSHQLKKCYPVKMALSLQNLR